MTDIEPPFGLPLTFDWNADVLGDLIACDQSGWLARLYSGHRVITPPVPEGFDGVVPVPRLYRLADIHLRQIVDAYLGALASSLGPDWQVCDGAQSTRNRNDEFAGVFHDPKHKSLEFVGVQLARRNFKLVSSTDERKWRKSEMAIDPLTTLVAIHQLIRRPGHPRRLPPLHIFTPGLMYQARHSGFNDLTRIDLEPPFVNEDASVRPGIITLDWNWNDANRARDNYNVGTLIPVHF